MRRTTYTTQNHGDVIICEEKKTVQIWLDPEQCMEGCPLDADDDSFISDCEVWFKDIDFSDLPVKGEFKNTEEAKKYLEIKFGKLMSNHE